MFGAIRKILAGADRPTILFALATAWPIMGFLPSMPSMVLYLISLSYAVYCFLSLSRMDGLCMAFLVYIPIELLLAKPNSVFNSWSRFVFFSALLMNVSPLLQSGILRRRRELLFQMMMWVCVFIGVGSFFARFLGINYMRTYSIESLSIAGTFGGLTTQSMMLGPIAGIAACNLSSNAMKTKRAIDWVWVVLALFSVLFSASRSALLAALTGVVVTLFCQSGSTSRFLRVAIVAIVIASSTFSLWEGALAGVIEKNGSSTMLNTDSRQRLWEERIDDFKSSPVIGVGFCAATVTDWSQIDLESGRLESGTSWIIIFSMLGVLGACFVIPIFIRAFRFAYRQRDEFSSVLCGVLSLFFVHMFAEGYIFAGGSFLAFMLWLTVGLATDRKFMVEG